MYEDYLGGPSNYGRRRLIWQGITYYLLMLVNSGVPLKPSTRPWGSRPELQFPELLRKPTRKKLPKNSPSAHVTSQEAGGGKSHQPKRKKEEEKMQESDAKVSALPETSSGRSPPAGLEKLSLIHI